ncbi:hypothetical protein R1sor_023985 [Riccia sorocarpa]|uniref:Uncharacterized protein n=1 Tax=Riccia sorocarpa TaxID=122646 RepID=A0ABD3GRJ1_9MARC
MREADVKPVWESYTVIINAICRNGMPYWSWRLLQHDFNEFSRPLLLVLGGHGDLKKKKKIAALFIRLTLEVTAMMRLTPVKTTYKIEQPFPDSITLTELCMIGETPRDFRVADICEHVGLVGVTPQIWATDAVDWYLPGAQTSIGDLKKSSKGSKTNPSTRSYRRTSVYALTYLVMEQHVSVGSRPPSIKQEARLKAAEQRAVTSSQTKEVPKAKTVNKKMTKKNIDASITIGIAGADVSGEVFDRLASYMKEYAMMGIMRLEEVMPIYFYTYKV